MNEQIRILLVEDSFDDVALIEHLLKKEGLVFVSKTVENREDYEKQLKEFQPHVVISDHSLPQFNSMEALDIFREYRANRYHAATFVLVTGTVSEEFAVRAMQSGADDYILKDRLRRLPSAIINALEKNRLREQKRKEEEEKLYLFNILEKSLHEIFVIDPDTFLFDYANDEALKNLGYSQEEIIQKSPLHVTDVFNKENLKSIFTSVEQSRKGRIFETNAIRKNGMKYPIQIHLQLIEQGAKKKFLANVLDISEARENEKQKELALFIQNCFSEDRSLEESLDLVLAELCSRSGIPAAEIWVKDFDDSGIKNQGRWNEGKTIPPKTGKFFAEMAFRSGTTIKRTSLQEEKFLRDGKLFKEDKFKGAMAYPIKSGKETTAVMVVFTLEIIEERDPFINLREGVQDKLAGNIKRKKTEEELQKIFAFSPDVLAIIGKDGYVKKINPSFRKILGHSEKEVLSKPFHELIHPEDKMIFESWKATEIQENEVMYYESRWRATDGEYRWFAWSVTPFFKEELQFAVGKDITETKNQVKEIRIQNQKLAEIAWEQSHIVRAPLTRLMACISYLEGNEENREEIMDSIKASAYELDEIVKGIVNKTERITGDGRN